MKSRLVVLLIAFVLEGCEQTIVIDIKSFESATVTYIDEKPSKTISNTTNSEASLSLLVWFSENRSGWERYYITEPVGDLLVSVGKYRLNIGVSSVILKYRTEKNEIVQLIKDIEANEFLFLK